VHQPIDPHETTWHPLAGFSWIYCFFFKYVDKIQVWLKPDKNNRHFTWRPLNIYDNFVCKCYHGCLNSNCLISSCELHGAQLRITEMCNPNIYSIKDNKNVQSQYLLCPGTGNLVCGQTGNIHTTCITNILFK
jgi:hypothetical protein